MKFSVIQFASLAASLPTLRESVGSISQEVGQNVVDLAVETPMKAIEAVFRPFVEQISEEDLLAPKKLTEKFNSFVQEDVVDSDWWWMWKYGHGYAKKPYYKKPTTTEEEATTEEATTTTVATTTTTVRTAIQTPTPFIP
eukprot:GHVP01066665.1.p3 GENE.GHVP01066665.1~~GHVP01066665.1.p3  ORF type:complete len:140 (+),score=40.51 GHVP01066665.1:394-813(+)